MTWEDAEADEVMARAESAPGCDRLRRHGAPLFAPLGTEKPRFAGGF